MLVSQLCHARGLIEGRVIGIEADRFALESAVDGGRDAVGGQHLAQNVAAVAAEMEAVTPGCRSELDE